MAELVRFVLTLQECPFFIEGAPLLINNGAFTPSAMQQRNDVTPTAFRGSQRRQQRRAPADYDDSTLSSQSP